MDESELYDTFSEQDRREPSAWLQPSERVLEAVAERAVTMLLASRFLLRIFQHLIFGGASNQSESYHFHLGVMWDGQVKAHHSALQRIPASMNVRYEDHVEDNCESGGSDTPSSLAIEYQHLCDLRR